MFGRKRSFGILISALLLLSFSVTILPLDFLHTHASVSKCTDGAQKDACQHKLHLSTKSSYCWLCAIHYDKTFIGGDLASQLKSLPFFEILSKSELTSYFAELILSTLRGPPAQ